MVLSPTQLTELANEAMDAAVQAGELIASYTDKTVIIKHKIGGDSVASQVVTEVDLKSEAIIVKALKPTCKKYDLALLTEETEDDKSRLDKNYYWCVDPMDGTLAFTESTPGYAVSIALVAKTGEPVIGVVYDPSTTTLYSSVKNQGALRDRKPWAPDNKLIQNKPLTLVCDRGFTKKSYYGKLCETLESIMSKHSYTGLQIIEKNGAVLNACFVLENSPAIYFKLPKPEQGGGSLWDFAATAAIFIELGFIATDFYGEPLELNRTDSTYMNHRGVMFSMDPRLAVEAQELLKLL